MEETIWSIISRRIVCQHLADLDLMLGLICFSAWSHYFKRDKPFMVTVTQLAVALAYELGLNSEAATPLTPRTRAVPKVIRTLEERRTILALYHLTSSTWTAYRKTEPLHWTPYLEDCLSIIGQGKETTLDILLATQIKCQIVTAHISCNSSRIQCSEFTSGAHSTALTSALLGQLSRIQQELPPDILSQRVTQLYIHSSRLTVLEPIVNRTVTSDDSGSLRFQRFKDLDSLLVTIERWMAVFIESTPEEWLSINVDCFAQFTQALVVLFKLTTLEESGWDIAELRRRLDLFEIMDRICDSLDKVPAAMGMVNTKGQRSGLFFKVTYLLRAIKVLFLREMPSAILDSYQPPKNSEEHETSLDWTADPVFTDEFIMSLAQEPWLSEILNFS